MKMEELINDFALSTAEELYEKVCNAICDDKYWSFPVTVFPYLQQIGLSTTIENILTDMAFQPVHKKWRKCSGPALYICARLRLSKIKEILVEQVEKINDPQTFENQEYINFINVVIGELKIHEAIPFLIKQLNIKPQQLWTKTAFVSLDLINPELALQYRNNIDFNLYPSYKAVEEWEKLNSAELKKEIIKIILGFGMSGSTSHFSFIPEYYDKIGDQKLKDTVNNILIGLIDDIESRVADRAMYICATLKLSGLRDRLIGILNRTNDIFEIINSSNDNNVWGYYISYINSINYAIKNLGITEAKENLIRQLMPLEKPAPPPITKEYYLYYESAMTALDALKKIDPELAKKYEAGIHA